MLSGWLICYKNRAKIEILFIMVFVGLKFAKESYDVYNVMNYV